MKSTDDILQIIKDEVAIAAVTDFEDSFSSLSQRCESDIEKVMLAALIFEAPEGVEIRDARGHDATPFNILSVGAVSGVDYVGAIYPQISLGRYRADFYMEVFDQQTMGCWYRAAIECDGHDFHERTKDQVRRDKRRDRWFQTQGIIVLRFSGSEIWATPLDAAAQVYDAFFAARRRRLGH